MADDMASGNKFIHGSTGNQNVVFGNGFQYNDSREFTINLPGMSSVLYLAETIKGETSPSERKRTTIMEWLQRQPNWCPFDSRRRLGELSSQAMPGIGEWALKSNDFQAWKDPSNPVRIMLVHGIRKSVTPSKWDPGSLCLRSSLFIQTIIQEVEARSSTACIYFYPPEEDENPSPARIWATLLEQLIQHEKSETISPALLSRFNASLTGCSQLHPFEYWGLFKAQAETFETVYLIMDEPESYIGHHEHMVQSLRNLPSNVKFLFTCRTETLASHLKVDCKLRVILQASELTLYVRRRLEDDVNLSGLLDKSHDREDVVEKVTELTSQSGMFLLARLHMDNLSRCSTLASIKDALSDLPKDGGHMQAFRASIRQITEKHSDFDKRLAKHVLTWVVYAKIGLTVDQVLDSFAFQHCERGKYWKSRPSKEKLISAVAGLAVLDSDEKTCTLRLVHESVKQLLHEDNLILQDPDLLMAKTCLKCLLIDESEIHEQNVPLLPYAARHWSSHLGRKWKGADRDAKILISFFFGESTKLTRAFKAMPETLGSDVSGMTGLHAAVHFNLISYADELIKTGIDVNAQCADGQTALHWAVRLRRRRLLQTLACKSDANILDRSKNTPLHRALVVPVTDGVGIVQSLIHGGARLDVRGAKGLTALSSAVKYGPTAIAEILLKSQDNANEEITPGWTSLRELFYHDYMAEMLGASADTWKPLQHAAEDHVRYLIDVVLDRGIDLNRPTSDNWLPLIHAVQTENLPRIRRLLEREPFPADVNKKDPTYHWAPLRWAITYKRKPEVIRMLIEHRAHINEIYDGDWAPLIEAIKNNDEELVWLLLKWGAQPDLLDRNKWSALLHAIKGGNSNIVWLLVSNKADVQSHSSKALELALERSDYSLAWLLCEHGADPNITDDEGMTPLHWASCRGNLKDVCFLLDRGADIGRIDKEGSTPLHLAVNEGFDKVVAQLALRAFGQRHLEMKNAHGNTALTLASLKFSKPMVQILLRMKASCGTQDPGGLTALHHAALLGFNDGLQLMLLSSTGRRHVNRVDKKGYSPLHAALISSKADILTIHILVTSGADLGAEVKDGALTPLMLAVHLNKEAFVRQLLHEGAKAGALNKTTVGIHNLINKAMKKKR
ncbi:ankyrin [Trichoderma citrinoviride]|uniref:Ankyrin n=1 Tax=Trichoderma citrinoviride TaxID=58853 RepID=A0A2T4B6C1_9HYPO|nr:ankyrin [Trichoderma citrinoviride]PTB64883.1 ankyrin [Trichoderma citrinoviride]